MSDLIIILCNVGTFICCIFILKNDRRLGKLRKEYDEKRQQDREEVERLLFGDPEV
jgi:hypothetical protein